jgi:hypothetical protein
VWTSTLAPVAAHSHRPIRVIKGVGGPSPRVLQMNATSETFHTAKIPTPRPIKVTKAVGGPSPRVLQMNATSETFHTAKIHRPRVCPKSVPASRCVVRTSKSP